MADRRRFASLPDGELERALSDLGPHLAFPATPDLASAVRARIADRPGTRTGLLTWLTPRRGLAAAAVLLVFLLVGALAVVPGARDAVAELIGVQGIQITIERDEPTPTPAGTPVGPSLALGRQTTLAEAQTMAPYAIHIPDPATYGEPDEIYVRTLPDGNIMVSLIYHPAPGLPEAAETGVGALLMQFRAREDVAYIGKGIFGGGNMEQVNVNGAEGWWVTGASEVVMLEDPSAPACCLPGRPSANVLLWEEDGVTFRLESDLFESRVVAMAESLRAAP